MIDKYEENNFFESYEQKKEHLIDTLDFNKLAEINKKKLIDLTETDLEYIGFRKVNHHEISNLGSVLQRLF